ncbi:unnamed protein product [Linum tenue]|uniref:Uncharacterized protein n=1 Tax=Linum tenue TaxID=586396 RepID=A0AAV0R837_9ROSI|nr:unnamed protein product [Linum tenue]
MILFTGAQPAFAGGRGLLQSRREIMKISQSTLFRRLLLMSLIMVLIFILGAQPTFARRALLAAGEVSGSKSAPGKHG